MALERSLWAWLKKARLVFGAALHMERVENSVGAGFPDVEGYLQTDEHGGQFALELKSSERPVRNTTPVRFKFRNREAQIEWMAQRWRLGGNAFFLLQVGSGPDRILYLVPGDHGELLARGVIEAQLAVFALSAGVFAGKAISQKDILIRAVTCRQRQQFLLRQ